MIRGAGRYSTLITPTAGSLFHAEFHRLYPQRLEPTQHLLSQDPVDAHPAAGNAACRCEVIEGARAFVAIGLAVADAKLLAAPGAAKQAGQSASPGRIAPRLMNRLPLALSAISCWFLSNSAQEM